MKKALLYTLAFMSVCCMSTSCEKPLIDDNENTEKTEGKVRITINAARLEQTTFEGEDAQSRATRSVGDLCSRITLAVFDMNGARVSTENQTSKGSDFGKFNLSLPKGTYTFLFVANSGAAAPNISSPSKIMVKNDDMSDTFYYCDDIEIGEDGFIDITLRRATAKFKLYIKDKTPESIKQIRFSATGGSLTFDATTGYGTTASSSQTEKYEVQSDAYTGPSSYEMYTFVRESGTKLKVTVTAHEKASSSVAAYTKTLQNIPMSRNVITQYSGTFFGEDPGSGRGFNVKIDDEWEQENYEF